MFTCISCKIAFETAEEQRSHFGTDWHRYNMKRRVANLPPVSALAFNEKVIERREQNAVRPDPKGMTCSACNKVFSSENSFRSHIQSKKHREREAAHARPTNVDLIISEESNSSTVVDVSGGHEDDTPSTSSVAFRVTSDGDDPMVDDDGSECEDEDYDIEQTIAASRRRISPTDCLFCPHQAVDTLVNVSHMASVHSFFIPDQDILLDLDGLLAYLGEKVAVANLCLFCPNGGKEFGSVNAVRKHMIDKCHCKIAYETEEDRAELADFYDFGGMEDSDWEDVDDGVDEGDSEILQSSAPSIAADGLSLVLPSGRVVGHRALKVYYSQRLRMSDSNAEGDAVKSKVALVRQRLADPSSSLVPIAGGHGAFGRGLEVVKARNAGEASWAKKQGRSFKDQRTREAFKTKVGFRHNSQKHFRDPLLGAGTVGMQPISEAKPL